MSSEEVPTARHETAVVSETTTETTTEAEAERPELKLTDPKAMRALAHPVRMALLELIEVTGTLTATQASEVLGESPANCAFHLRTLGKYGYIVEAGGGKGRERPWKHVTLALHVSTDQETQGAVQAARTLRQIWLDRVLQRARNILGSDERPEGWHEVGQASRVVQFLTREETIQLGDEIRQLMDQYEERHDNPAKRPEGSLPVELLYLAYPLTRLADIAATDDAAGQSEQSY